MFVFSDMLAGFKATIEGQMTVCNPNQVFIYQYALTVLEIVQAYCDSGTYFALSLESVLCWILLWSFWSALMSSLP